MNGNNTLTLTSTMLSSLTDDLQTAETALKKLRERLILLIPAKEGSDLKFLQETMQAQEEIRQGKCREFSNAKDMIKYLKQI